MWGAGDDRTAALERGMAALTERVERLEADGWAPPHKVETLGDLHREIGALREQRRRAQQDALDAQIGH